MMIMIDMIYDILGVARYDTVFWALPTYKRESLQNSLDLWFSAGMADQTNVANLIRQNESSITFCLSNNASVLESLIDSCSQKNLFTIVKTPDSDPTASDRSSVLLKNIITVLDTDDSSIVIQLFNENKILRELLTILEIKSKG